MTWRVDEVRLYRWATSGEWLVLLALGWRIEFIDERYGTILMSCVESQKSFVPIEEAEWAAQRY
jgi:hypothetical protein